MEEVTIPTMELSSCGSSLNVRHRSAPSKIEEHEYVMFLKLVEEGAHEAVITLKMA